MKSADNLFIESISRLRENYTSYKFFVERDIVWTVQCYMDGMVRSHGLPFQVFNDYPILKMSKRSLCVDIAIVNLQTNKIELIAEFKYEPAHNRTDIPKSKFPVVVWGKDGVGKDIARINEFVKKGLTDIGYSIFIDEGGAFAHRDPHSGASWHPWNDNGKLLVASAPNTLGSQI